MPPVQDRDCELATGTKLKMVSEARGPGFHFQVTPVDPLWGPSCEALFSAITIDSHLCPGWHMYSVVP